MDIKGLDFKEIQYGNKRIIARLGFQVTSTGLQMTMSFWRDWAKKHGFCDGTFIDVNYAEAGDKIAIQIRKSLCQDNSDKAQLRPFGKDGILLNARLVRIKDFGVKLGKVALREDDISKHNEAFIFLFDKRQEGENLPPPPKLVRSSPKKTVIADNNFSQKNAAMIRPKQSAQASVQTTALASASKVDLNDMKLRREIYRCMNNSDNLEKTIKSLAERFFIQAADVVKINHDMRNLLAASGRS